MALQWKRLALKLLAKGRVAVVMADEEAARADAAEERARRAEAERDDARMWRAGFEDTERRLRDLLKLSRTASLIDAVAVLAAPAEDALREALRAGLDYCDALETAAREPRRMSSFQTVTGDTLDSLFERWVALARSALAPPPAATETRPTPANEAADE